MTRSNKEVHGSAIEVEYNITVSIFPDEKDHANIYVASAKVGGYNMDIHEYTWNIDCFNIQSYPNAWVQAAQK